VEERDDIQQADGPDVEGHQHAPRFTQAEDPGQREPLSEEETPEVEGHQHVPGPAEQHVPGPAEQHVP
jgi:hypothetical protein